MVFNLRTYSFTESDEGDPTPPKSFSLKQLRVATDNFSSKNIVGDDWYGTVYRGSLADGSLVAVKRASSVDWLREEHFESEVQVGSAVSTHPNVLCLRGFHRTQKELLLVYPLMINHSLSYNLTERQDRFARPIDWTTRKRIALGAARGLAHLHNQGNFKIMHRYICASSILLNVDFEAVIGLFRFPMIMHERNAEEGTIEWITCMPPRHGAGVSFSSPAEENSADSGFDSLTCHCYEDVYVSTPITGKFGFIAPEYLYTEKCTLKNDVFAFGRMLLELISGQLINNFLTEVIGGEAFLPEDGVRKLMNKDQLGRVMDPNLQGNYAEEQAEQLLRLPLLCSHEDPSVRPEMSEVVRMLESQFLQRDPSTRSSWSQSECDSTPYHSFPPSPSPLGFAP
ncbi:BRASSINOSTEROID INSENSITIVE 1-associated receptor kinase 1-like [Eucalyptus grandis]|uniref:BRASSINOSTEROID INSENSITIVE 1-associated receptor kinase 1-like n=1 Tax=Eucalyptus grandis TaxID=71139 RepID=UPI00192ECB0E|nr:BRASSINOSTEROID INSENSITIVE 1-associated receptor kinase 1-like [Eucalyptus grandis]